MQYIPGIHAVYIYTYIYIYIHMYVCSTVPSVIFGQRAVGTSGPRRVSAGDFEEDCPTGFTRLHAHNVRRYK